MTRAGRLVLPVALVLAIVPRVAPAELQVRVLVAEAPDAAEATQTLERRSGQYHGALEIRPLADGHAALVNEVPLEAYVAGTLAREVPASWDPAVLRAQAVVARTYALHHIQRDADAAFHLRADTRGQVYGGRAAERPSTRAAARDTRGEFLAFEGRPILAAYHSASGGRTATAEEVWGQRVPYLVSVSVEGEDESPDTYWRLAVSRATLRRALAPLDARLGGLRELAVAERSPSGRVRWIEARGPAGREQIEGRRLRSVLGEHRIRSTLFEVREAEEGFVFVGSGRGHGVGMSQWGARAMAAQGKNYREIVSHFYPGTRIERTDRRR